ncbi:hypothetical protein CRG98_014921 [Punica granatum]|uniref:Uncharacterized protein n=1 Tax=Punica granatum TaxID=22663 RepID=A0A2I0K829_PUNGR|nr:hypothetical protein CRG98_014921 [Punica granatum]
MWNQLCRTGSSFKTMDERAINEERLDTVTIEDVSEKTKIDFKYKNIIWAIERDVDGSLKLTMRDEVLRLAEKQLADRH